MDAVHTRAPSHCLDNFLLSTYVVISAIKKVNKHKKGDPDGIPLKFKKNAPVHWSFR